MQLASLLWPQWDSRGRCGVFGSKWRQKKEPSGVNEKQTFLGHLMLPRWVIGPRDVCGIEYEMPWVKSVLCLSLNSYTEHLCYFISFFLSRAVSGALGTAMTTSQSNSQVQMEVFWQWVNATNLLTSGLVCTTAFFKLNPRKNKQKNTHIRMFLNVKSVEWKGHWWSQCLLWDHEGVSWTTVAF